MIVSASSSCTISMETIEIFHLVWILRTEMSTKTKPLSVVTRQLACAPEYTVLTRSYIIPMAEAHASPLDTSSVTLTF